jgi:hypothetical protein
VVPAAAQAGAAEVRDDLAAEPAAAGLLGLELFERH